MKPRIMYVENKTGGLTGGEARIGWVTFSKTGKTLYYRGRKLQSLKGQGHKSNYFDLATGEEFWISGPKRDGSDQLYGQRGGTHIDADARKAYWTTIRRRPGDVRLART